MAARRLPGGGWRAACLHGPLRELAMAARRSPAGGGGLPPPPRTAGIDILEGRTRASGTAPGGVVDRSKLT